MCADGMRVLTHLRSTRCSVPLYCAIGQISGRRQTGRYLKGRICGFILLCIGGWRMGVSVLPAQPSPAHGTKSEVLAAQTVIKPAPQFPPTREAPPSVPSLLPGRTPVGRITSGPPVACWSVVPAACGFESLEVCSLPARPPLSPHLAVSWGAFILPSQAVVAAHGDYCLPLRVWGLRDESK